MRLIGADKRWGILADEQAPPLLSLHWVELPIRNFPDGYSREGRGGESFFHQGGRTWVGVGDISILTNNDRPIYQQILRSIDINMEKDMLKIMKYIFRNINIDKKF